MGRETFTGSIYKQLYILPVNYFSASIIGFVLLITDDLITLCVQKKTLNMRYGNQKKNHDV